MVEQNHAWSQVAASYEREFVDPYLGDVKNPLPAALKALVKKGAKVVADLGCGIGPLLPLLSETFERVIAVDFASGMLDRARRRCPSAKNITFVEANLADLSALAGTLDVAVAVNSLVMPSVALQETVLRQIHAALKPGGSFTGILPAMDGVHYQTMLLLDRALDRGQPLDAARKSASFHNDHSCYDFAFGQFRFQGVEQHFWQPFEIPYRFRRAGFRNVKKKKVELSWTQFAGKNELREYSPPWDWFFLATTSSKKKP